MAEPINDCIRIIIANKFSCDQIAYLKQIVNHYEKIALVEAFEDIEKTLNDAINGLKES